MEHVRFSGSLKLTVSYIESLDNYNVEIEEINNRATFVTQRGIHLPPAKGGLDRESAKAIGLVANAALGFASYYDEEIYAYARDTENGDFVVRRLGLVG